MHFQRERMNSRGVTPAAVIARATSEDTIATFVHGSPQANLLKIMFDKHSPHQRYATNSQIAERFQRDVVGPSFLWSFFSIAQATAELTLLFPNDVALTEAAYSTWAELSVASLPTKAVWEIRTRRLLGVICN
jgi:hypothetical protein